ncbi:YhdP family protein [Undibacterium cyanobacteriorum]|uniref:YhdP family protein n=1 Tax=Undibacterium cyanobacteriorum TaxID=3073561 RepID=A0ABY9RMC9_9BURK|nr:YhdP family protein [Undibacterium sp. 20NA77.5]WMW82352.1 YhdP family protein [Undibacterium sp. 20NA77.5]
MFKFSSSQKQLHATGRAPRSLWRNFKGFCLVTAHHSGRTARFTLRWCWRSFLLAYFLLATLFLVSRFLVLPSLENYKPEFEDYASKQLHREVKIGGLHARWQGWHPEIDLQNVRVLDANGNPALVLPEVHTQISWWSIFAFDLRFSRFELVGPSLQARRLSDGQIEVAGFRLAESKPGGDSAERALSWILAQNELSIANGRFVWINDVKPEQQLELDNFNLLVRNEWRHHRLAIQATPPAVLAAPIDLRLNLHQSLFAKKQLDLGSWSGEIFLDLKEADLPKLKNYVSLPFTLEKSVGAVKAWLRLEGGHVADFTADLALRDVLGRFRQDLPPLDMDYISGRVIATERVIKDYRYLPNILGQTGHSIAVENFSMQTRDGKILPSTSVRETYVPAHKDQAEKVELHAKLLDLQSIANFAEHLPLPADQRRLLIDVAPKGVLKDFTARWQGSLPNVTSYTIDGEFSGLEMRPLKAQLARAKSGKIPARAGFPAIPGFDNVSGSISANEKGGRLSLDSKDLKLQLPSYFVDPEMPFDRFVLQSKWDIQNNQSLRFEIQNLEFEQNGTHGRVHGSHRRDLTQMDLGEVELQGELDGFDLRTITRYIPEKTPEHLRHWLSSALLEGKANNVSLRLNGRLRDFPFTGLDSKGRANGEFIVKGNIANGKLNFLPGVYAKDGVAPFWPVIDSIKGGFVFEKSRMEIRAESALTNQVPLNKVVAVIPDLASHEAVLQIDGNATGNLQAMFGYVKASPVDEWLGQFLHDATGSGNAQLGLKLFLPLHNIIDSKVTGVLQLNGNESQLQTSLPHISGITGKLEFNERGLNLYGLKAQALGGPLVASGGTQKDGSIRMRFEGVATSDGIQNQFKGSELTPLLSKLSGNSRYLTQVNVKRRALEVIVESNLQGLGIDLPEPFAKLPTENLPLHFELQPEPASDHSELRDTVKVAVGERLLAQYQRRRKLENGAKTQVVRGAIGINAPLSIPEDGLTTQLNLKSLVLDDWARLFDQNGSQLTASTSVNSESEMLQYVMPKKISLTTDTLVVMGKRLDKLVVGASRSGNSWQANVDAKQISGALSWSPPNERHEQGLIAAKLSRLSIPKSAAGEVGELLQAKNLPQSLPALEVQADQFELYGKTLGHLDLAAKNVRKSNERQWVIEQLRLKNEDAELKANGSWNVSDHVSKTALNFSLDIANAGFLLERFGFKELMRAGKGKIEGDVNWQGLPFEFDIPSLAGQLQLKMSAGQFLKVDPAGSKLIGVLNMQSIPRRFTLDFRDVFSEGFAFDTIAGTARIEKGVAHTDNLKMNSVSATVLMEGNADIGKEIQDLHVAVIPDLNVGAASMVYGLAVNPVVGLGTFLAQLLFKDPLKRAFTYEYRVTGPWTDPVVVKLENAERQAILEKQRAEKLKADKLKADQADSATQKKP